MRQVRSDAAPTPAFVSYMTAACTADLAVPIETAHVAGLPQMRSIPVIRTS